MKRDALSGAIFRGVVEVVRADPRGTLVVMNIDHFKAFNAHNGHEVGDEALARLGELLARDLEAGETVHRTHGDVFAVVLRRPLPAALDWVLGLQVVAAQRLTPEQVAHCGSSVCSGPSPPLTLSFGLVELEGKTPAEALLAEAEERVYAAKAGGRNRVQAV